MRHHALVVTSWKRELVDAARDKAKQLGLPASAPVQSTINGFVSILVAPDGSKEGWDASRYGDAMRGAFMSWLKEQAHEELVAGVVRGGVFERRPRGSRDAPPVGPAMKTPEQWAEEWRSDNWTCSDFDILQERVADLVRAVREEMEAARPVGTIVVNGHRFRIVRSWIEDRKLWFLAVSFGPLAAQPRENILVRLEDVDGGPATEWRHDVAWPELNDGDVAELRLSMSLVETESDGGWCCVDVHRLPPPRSGA